MVDGNQEKVVARQYLVEGMDGTMYIIPCKRVTELYPMVLLP